MYKYILEASKNTNQQRRTTMEVMSLKQVIKKTTLCNTSIREMIKEGNFPPPFKIAPRRIVWNAEEIESWIEEKFNTRLKSN